MNEPTPTQMGTWPGFGNTILEVPPPAAPPPFPHLPPYSTPSFDVRVMSEVSRGNHVFHRDSTDWLDVNEDVRWWLVESCRRTALELTTLPECPDPSSFSVKYQVDVFSHRGMDRLPDSTEVEFGLMSFESLMHFQRWVIKERYELVTLMESQRQGKVRALRERPPSSLLWLAIKNLFASYL